METKRVRKLKFAHPSGSRPLEGYTVKRGIGVGGFGEVYFALSDAGKEVALKKIQRNMDIELRGVRQCLNLKHINLIRLWDICTNEDGESWVVMEYVPGDSLRDRVDANPNGMPLELVHRWFLSTASGVAYLHSRGIVHRDLKPGNIFYDDDEQVVKIGDYGLSKFISCSRRSGQTESVGTFHYMAPEIGKGVYGKEIDIYALGIILFEMLTGRVPFEGESSQEIIMKHLTADPDVSGLAEPYAAIISKAMCKDPEMRYRNVQEMINHFPSDGMIPDRIGPIPDADPIPATTENNASANGNVTANVPPIQPLFIDDQDIVFGDVQEVVSAESIASPTDSTQGHQTSPYAPNAVQSSSATIVPVVERVEVVAADAVTKPQEPIAKAVVGGWTKFKTWWYSGNLNAPIKVILVVFGALIIIKNSEWLLPTALSLGVLYLIYYAIRTWTLKPPAPKKQSVAAQKQKLAAQKQKVAKPVSNRQLVLHARNEIRHSLGRRPIAERIPELLGSMLISSMVVIILGLLGYVASSVNEVYGLDTISMFACATVVATLGSWAILVVGKLFESEKGEWLARRFTMLAIGLLVGFVAVGVGSMLDMGGILSSHASNQTTQLPFFQDHLHMIRDGQLKWPALVCCFCGLFVILRWWRQADPVRKTRLSIVGVGICIVWAVIFGSIFGVDLVWISLVAGMMAVATQLASPWIHPKRRIQWIESQELVAANRATHIAG